MKNASLLNKRIEIWRNQLIKNELGEDDIQPVFYRKVWASVVPQTGALMKGQAETILSNVSKKVIIRFTKDIKEDDFLMISDKRHDIKYILNPYERNETLELFCELKG